MAAMNWLFKEEPSNYNFDAFVKDKQTTWSGVKNPVAQRNLRSVKKLARPVTLKEIKADPFFKDFDLVRISRLSVMPVTDAQWTRIVKLAG